MEIVPDSAGVGNTKTTPEKQPNKAKRWCFTLNNYSEKEYNELETILRAKSTRFIIGKEVGESGTPHLQGYYELEPKGRPSELKLSHKRTHFEIAKGSDIENYKYCSKDNNFIENFPDEWKRIHGLIKLKCIEESQLYEWQKNIIEAYKQSLKVYDDRKIYWLWSEKGGVGKTNFIKYLMINYNFGFLQNAKCADVAQYCITHIKKGYAINYTRSMSTKINYSALESLKDGLLFSGKYESDALIMDSPFVVCFSNEEPDRDKLSNDRWIIINID